MTQSTRRLSGALLIVFLLSLTLAGCVLPGSDPVPLTEFEPSGDPLPVPEEQNPEEPEAETVDLFATQTQQAVESQPEEEEAEEDGDLIVPEEEEAEDENDEVNETEEDGSEEVSEETEEPTTEETPVEEPTEEAPETEEVPTPTQVVGVEGGEEYTVQVGDNLFRIAQRFDVTVEQIAAANGITNAEAISAGQTIIIPGIIGNATTPQPTGKFTEYIIEPGDTLYSIAIDNNLTAQELASFNEITDVNSIFIGQVIRIPQE